MGYAQNSLISCIYDMALRHSTWENILDILKASLPDCLILVYGNDLVTRTSIAFAQRGLSAEATSSFVSTFSAINPWLPGQAQLAKNYGSIGCRPRIEPDAAREQRQRNGEREQERQGKHRTLHDIASRKAASFAASRGMVGPPQ